VRVATEEGQGFWETALGYPRVAQGQAEGPVTLVRVRLPEAALLYRQRFDGGEPSETRLPEKKTIPGKWGI